MICKDIINKYLSYLEQSFVIENTRTGCRIITPFIGYNGESITFYVDQLGDNLRITDKGNTLIDLEIKDIHIDSGKEKEIFDDLLNLYELKEESGRIVVDTDIQNLPHFLALYINALQSLYCMEYISSPARLKPFTQIVHEYCELNKLIHQYKYRIKLGAVNYTIDITSMEVKNLIQTIGTNIQMKSYMKDYTEGKIIPFLTLELEKYLQERTKFYRVILYEDEVNWDNESMALMEDYSDEIIKWTERKKLEKLLTI